MTRETQHKNVGAGAEAAVFETRNHHRAHLGVLKSNAVQRIVELDIDAEVIAVEFELVSGAQARILVNVDGQRGYSTVKDQLEVFVLRGIGLVLNAGVTVNGCLLGLLLAFIAAKRAAFM